MPPSGYSTTQADHMSLMLESCSEALVREASENGETLLQALEREIDSIGGYLDRGAHSTAQRAVLLLTEEFYSSVLAETPGDVASFRLAVRRVLESFRREMLAIHSPMFRSAA